MAVNRYLSSIPARTLSGRISSNLFSVVVDLHTSQEYNWGNVIGFNVVIISGSIIFFVVAQLSLEPRWLCGRHEDEILLRRGAE